MRRPKAFRPDGIEMLEGRVVLSSFSNSVYAAARGLGGRAALVGRQVNQPVVNRVNEAFDKFVVEYSQARAAYLSTLQPGTSTPEPNPALIDPSPYTAFIAYTRYRVDLLGQELASSFLQGMPAQAKQGGGGAQAAQLATVVRQKVNGLEITATSTAGVPTLGGRTFRIGSLGRALVDTIPPANSPAATAGLLTLAQDQAIEASRVAVLNGLNSAKRMAKR
jgi:hypothetical protein